MPNSISKTDLETILEFIQKKDKEVISEVKSSLTEDMLVLEERIANKISESIYENVLDHIKDNPDYRGPMGYSGKDGEPGETGSIGEQGPRGHQGPLPHIDIDAPAGRIRFQTGINESNGMAQFSDWINVKGEKGDTLTWHDLTEAQRQMLVGPQGHQGPKGDPGKFPRMDADPENRRVRFQVSEDVQDPWGPWLDIPKGDQGEQGPQGERFVYEDFTPQQLEEIRGPQGFTGPQGEKGDKGDQGDPGKDSSPKDVAKIVLADTTFRMTAKGEKGDKGDPGKDGKDSSPEEVATSLKADGKFLLSIKGEKGDKGDPGKDADMDSVFKEVEKLEKDLNKKHTNFEVNSKKQLNNDFEKVKNELVNKIDNVRFTRLNELLIPTQAFNVAGDPTGSEVVQEVGPFTNINDIIDGAPVYIDNPIKASLRGETYDPENFIIYADASDVVSVADGIIFKGVGRYAYVYRIGVSKVDPRVIADGPTLTPGEYYYLAHPKSGMNHSQITVNKPQFGVAQLVGQAISEDKLFVNCTTDPVVLNRTNIQIQGSNGSYLQAPTTAEGNPGDAFGDTVWDANYLYFCTRDYDGVSKIWRRTLIDTSW